MMFPFLIFYEQAFITGIKIIPDWRNCRVTIIPNTLRERVSERKMARNFAVNVCYDLF